MSERVRQSYLILRRALLSLISVFIICRDVSFWISLYAIHFGIDTSYSIHYHSLLEYTFVASYHIYLMQIHGRGQGRRLDLNNGLALVTRRGELWEYQELTTAGLKPATLVRGCIFSRTLHSIMYFSPIEDLSSLGDRIEFRYDS